MGKPLTQTHSHNHKSRSRFWIFIFAILIFPMMFDSYSCQQVEQTKRFLEPCDIIISQSHCSDDEDYDTNEECDLLKTDNCNRSLELYCIDGFCLPNCHPMKESYDEIQGKCFRKLGTDCKSTKECGTNTVCERKKCRCAKNYTLDIETGKCVRSSEFGEYCDQEISCDKLSDITCQSNRCDCKSTETQFYHSKRRRCYIYLGYNCTGGLQFCPDNSMCMREYQKHELIPNEMEEEHYLGIFLEDDTKVFKCQCDKGQATTLDGKNCLGLHGMSCNSLHKCNTERSLKCYNGTCQCSRPLIQLYDSIGQRCVNLVGAECKIEQRINSCVDWSQCIKDERTGISECKCISGFMSSPDGICYKGHGQSCTYNEEDLLSLVMDNVNEPLCNYFIGLECSNITGTCQCKDQEQFYDVKLQVCRNFEVVRMPDNIPFDTSDREYRFYEKAFSSGSFTGGRNQRNDSTLQWIFLLYIYFVYIF